MLKHELADLITKQTTPIDRDLPELLEYLRHVPVMVQPAEMAELHTELKFFITYLSDDVKPRYSPVFDFIDRAYHAGRYEDFVIGCDAFLGAFADEIVDEIKIQTEENQKN